MVSAQFLWTVRQRADALAGAFADLLNQEFTASVGHLSTLLHGCVFAPSLVTFWLVNGVLDFSTVFAIGAIADPGGLVVRLVAYLLLVPVFLGLRVGSSGCPVTYHGGLLRATAHRAPMETTAAFVGLECVDCADRFDPDTASHRCPSCGGILDPQYDLESVGLTRKALASRPFDSMWRYEELLPFPAETAVTLDEGATPLVPCPRLADELGVDRVFLKDEGRNPTGTFKDRGHALAVTAAVAHSATDIALASAGNAGQSATAYAARAGLDAHVFLPERAGFSQKAMVEVHGGDLTVVDGGLGQAGAALDDALADHDDWYPTSTFVTPYRHEGKKTMGYELLEQLDFEAPDAVVYPTGGGVGLVGVHKAAREFRTLGLVDELPPLYAAQSTGCAPIVHAWESGRSVHEPWAEPDTVCAGIEIPDPGASRLVLDALAESDGGAIAVPDEAILDAAMDVARLEGLETGATPAAAPAGARALAERDAFDADATVVLLSTGSGVKDADILRSHGRAGIR